MYRHPTLMETDDGTSSWFPFPSDRYGTALSNDYEQLLKYTYSTTKGEIDYSGLLDKKDDESTWGSSGHTYKEVFDLLSAIEGKTIKLVSSMHRGS